MCAKRRICQKIYMCKKKIYITEFICKSIRIGRKFISPFVTIISLFLFFFFSLLYVYLLNCFSQQEKQKVRGEKEKKTPFILLFYHLLLTFQCAINVVFLYSFQYKLSIKVSFLSLLFLFYFRRLHKFSNFVRLNRLFFFL